MSQPPGFDPLLEDGLQIHDAFLDPREISRLRTCVQQRTARGGFRGAHIAGSEVRREDIRGDFVCWVAEPLFAAERALLARFEALRCALNREATLGLFDLELHYALYPPGAGYRRHVDQPRGRSQRRVSVVLYLNEGWEPDAGGVLRVYDATGAPADVAPLAGRLVLFLTAGREHEVLPARHPRLSLSGWFRARE